MPPCFVTRDKLWRSGASNGGTEPPLPITFNVYFLGALHQQKALNSILHPP